MFSVHKKREKGRTRRRKKNIRIKDIRKNKNHKTFIKYYCLLLQERRKDRQRKLYTGFSLFLDVFFKNQ